MTAAGDPLTGVLSEQAAMALVRSVDQDEAIRTLRAGHRRLEADHAFANPSSGRYDAEAAEEAWRQVRDFLEGTLKSPS